MFGSGSSEDSQEMVPLFLLGMFLILATVIGALVIEVDDDVFDSSAWFRVVGEPTYDPIVKMNRLTVYLVDRGLDHTAFDPSGLIQRGEDVVIRDFRANFKETPDFPVERLLLAYRIPPNEPAP